MTGSGKTLAYVLPLLHRTLRLLDGQTRQWNQVTALIIVPTRELAKQIHTVVQSLLDCIYAESGVVHDGRQVGVTPQTMGCLLVTGGYPLQDDLDRLQQQEDHQAPTIMIATPGKLEELMAKCPKHKLDWRELDALVLDEADWWVASIMIVLCILDLFNDLTHSRLLVPLVTARSTIAYWTWDSKMHCEKSSQNYQSNGEQPCFQPP